MPKRLITAPHPVKVVNKKLASGPESGHLPSNKTKNNGHGTVPKIVVNSTVDVLGYTVGIEIRTCPVFEWLKKIGLCPDHSKTGLLDSLDRFYL